MRALCLGPLPKADPRRKLCGARSDARTHICWAGGLFKKQTVYIPSEENPADAPHPGVVRRWRSRQTPAPSGPRHVFDLVRKRHTKQSNMPYDICAACDDKMRRVLHEGPRASQNGFRRYFRDHSDVSSCTSVSASEIGSS